MALNIFFLHSQWTKIYQRRKSDQLSMKWWTTFILQKFFPLASCHIPGACCIAANFACVLQAWFCQPVSRKNFLCTKFIYIFSVTRKVQKCNLKFELDKSMNTPFMFQVGHKAQRIRQNKYSILPLSALGEWYLILWKLSWLAPVVCWTSF